MTSRSGYDRRRSRRRIALEPWYHACRIVLIPPFKLWFNWRFEGSEHLAAEGPMVVAGNHLSYVDPFAHAYFVVHGGRRPRFLAKAELFQNPFLRTVLRGTGQIPVRRGTGDQAPLEEATRALRVGEVVVVYPEGTSTSNPDFLPGRGKTGAVRLAITAGVPILPVATWGGQYVWRRGEERRVEFGRPIWMKAGDPIDVSSHLPEVDDVRALRRVTDELMGELTRLVEDLRDRYPKRWGRG